MSIAFISHQLKALSHTDKLYLLQRLVEEIAVEEGVDFKQTPLSAKNQALQFDWEGGLSDLNQAFSSVALQKKALEWR
jgi:hypothetical protein